MARAKPSATGAAIRSFTAVIEPDEADGGYVVTFPAIPDLATQGETLEEARRMAEECLRGYLEVLRETGRPPVCYCCCCCKFSLVRCGAAQNMDNRERYIIDRADLLQKSYNLLCLFFANKEIARRSDPADENAPLSSLEKLFFVRESSRLLIEIAILVRIIDDQMKMTNKSDSEKIRYYSTKKRVDKYVYCLFDDLDLDLRGTCNKIIHSKVMEPHLSEGQEAHEYDVAYLHGDSGRTIGWKHFNGYVRLYGRKDGESWYVLLNIEVFVSVIYELFQGNA